MVPTSGALEPLSELENEEPVVLKNCVAPSRRLSSTGARRMPRYFISSLLVVAACLCPLSATLVCLTHSTS